MKLLKGDLMVDDLPEAWKEESRRLFGIAPVKDCDGVLQDIHWSMGAIGYFPTYALGNLYSAQFYAKLKTDIPDADVSRGSFGDDTIKDVLAWLRKNIHCHGSVYPANELCRLVTGEPLNPGYFMDYLENKYGEIYGL
jgi:carboxypeptidase Taq